MDLHLAQRLLQKSEDPSGEPPPLARKTLRGRPINDLTTELKPPPVTAPPAPTPAPALAEAGTGQRLMPRLRRGLGLRWGVKQTWSKVGTAHLARRLLTGVRSCARHIGIRAAASRHGFSGAG